MNLEERIHSFIALGELLRDYPDKMKTEYGRLLQVAAGKSEEENPWFMHGSIQSALNAIGESLTREKLERWLDPYKDQLIYTQSPKKIGLVMAGNIPAVGFHDFISVLISGNILIAKLSARDKCLLPVIAKILCLINPSWRESITWTSGILSGFDAIIATGSNNSSRYFEYYFRKYPHIIRKNRNGVAVLTGDETSEQLQGLANDIMLYFGMGCRSVSKLFVPSGYSFSFLFESLSVFRHYFQHHKYRNNYEYYKSSFLVNNISFLDNGFFMMVQNTSIPTPVSVGHFEYYSEISEVYEKIRLNTDSIQCVVSAGEMDVPVVSPGKAQKPELWDYADGIDTLRFLTGKNSDS